jgi:hypothetical protein
MYSGPWRHVRSLTVSATCVALSVAGHLAGGGAAPDLRHAPVAALGLGVVTTLVVLVLAAASRRRWTFGRAVLALGLGQGALHVALTLLLAPAAAPAAATGPMPHMPAGTSGHGHGLSMTVGHTVAAVGVAAVIARTDAALAAWLSVSTAGATLRRAVSRLGRTLGAGGTRSGESRVHGPVCRQPGAWEVPHPIRPQADGRGPSRRGPPRPA